MQDQLDSNKEVEQLKMSLEHPDFLKPEKLEGETHYQYKVRRKMGQMYVKQKSKGQLMWIAKDIKQPVFAKEDVEMKGEPIGYHVSKGFSYNKAKVKRAYDKFMADKAKQETETINKQA